MTATTLRHDLGLTWYEASGMRRAAHALRDGDRVWFIDPFEDDAALGAAAELGGPAGVIQLLDRHNRDGRTIAERLEIPHLRLPAEVPGSPFAVLSVLDWPVWHEKALWWEAERALVVAEAIGTAPLMALGRRAGMHPMLRLTPPQALLGDHQPRRLLVGHGPPVMDGAAAAVQDALAHARSDIPQLVIRLPWLVRGA